MVTTRRGLGCTATQRYVCPTRAIAERFAALLLSAPAAAGHRQAAAAARAVTTGSPRGPAHSAALASSGSSTVNRAPLPGSLCTWIDPPSDSTIVREM